MREPIPIAITHRAALRWAVRLPVGVDHKDASARSAFWLPLVVLGTPGKRPSRPAIPAPTPNASEHHIDRMVLATSSFACSASAMRSSIVPSAAMSMYKILLS